MHTLLPVFFAVDFVYGEKKDILCLKSFLSFEMLDIKWGGLGEISCRFQTFQIPPHEVLKACESSSSKSGRI